MNEKVIGAIASALHLDASEFVTALKDGEKWLADDDMADVVSQKVAEQVKAAKEAQYKRGQREAWTIVEKGLKKQGFGNEEKLQGTTLMDAFFEQFSAKGDHEGKTLEQFTEADLAKLPTVKQLIAKGKEEAGKAFSSLQTEYDAAKSKWQSERVSDVAKRRMIEHLEEAKVLLELPGSTVSKATRVKAVASMLNFDEIGLNDKGDPVFLDADGSPKTDDFGKPLDFKKHIVSIGADLFGIQKQDPGKGGANPQNTGAKAAGTGDYVPSTTFATAADYNTALQGATTPEARLEVMKSWRHTQQQEAAGK